MMQQLLTLHIGAQAGKRIATNDVSPLVIGR